MQTIQCLLQKDKGTTVYPDYSVTISFISNPSKIRLHYTLAFNIMSHESIIRIENVRRFVKKKLIYGEFATAFVRSLDLLANLFTKSLRGPRLSYICNKSGTYNLYAPK